MEIDLIALKGAGVQYRVAGASMNRREFGEVGAGDTGEDRQAIRRDAVFLSSEPSERAGSWDGDKLASEERVRSVLASRRLREAVIGRELFADPAWDMLLELYAAYLAQRRISVSELVLASAVPGTTALRWIDKLESAGIATRANDPLHGRRVWVEISSDAAGRMDSYFEGISRGSSQA
jgi:DNA-binding MarR family transcriptional regulator